MHFLHFELWIFCIFACRFTCFHLHLCCGFLCLVRVFFSLCFVVFALLLCFAMCSTFTPCCCVVVPCYSLSYLATLPCNSLSHLVALPCCSSSHLVSRHALLFTVELIVHLRTLLLVVMLNYLHLCLVVYLSFFKHLLPPPPPIVVLLLCWLPSFLVVMPFYVNWYSFPTLLCKWRSLEQHQQVSFNKQR